MSHVHGQPAKLEIGRVRKLGLLSLVAVLSFAIAFGTLIPPPSTAQAESSEPWLYMECVERPVNEGDDFRLVVRKKYTGFDPAPYKKMRVFWYTNAITADQTDYEHMYAVRQASNSYQSRTGKMGRDFHTLEDQFSETEETYKVRFNNSNDNGSDDHCIITIEDDDGVGIFDLEFRSVPQEITVDANDHETLEAYTVGDVILITAKFTHPVTTKDPETGEQTDYAALYLQIGENRRLAHVVRGDGTDNIIFGYTVQADDSDLDGISVEEGGPGTGLYYNKDTRDSGLWPVNPEDGKLNRVFHGLDDDPDHGVYQAVIPEPVILPPVDEEPFIVEPVIPEWAEGAEAVEPNLLGKSEGDLTKDDAGRDWFFFEATGGEEYIIDLKNRPIYVDPRENGGAPFVGFAPGHLIDPSILEVVDSDGAQVLGERDQGGFLGNFARAFFTPQEDGTYYIAVGAGAQYPSGLGLYTISVRADDHADDYSTAPGVAIRPGESLTARIDSDVSPDDPGLNPWDWTDSDDRAVPYRGIETLDDRDFFRLEIAEEGTYKVVVSDGPPGVGIWGTWDANGNAHNYPADGTVVPSVVAHFQPGAYLVEVGTPYLSSGNTGTYTLALQPLPN